MLYRRLMAFIVLVFWPQLTAAQSDHVLKLFDQVAASGASFTVNDKVANLQNYAFNDLASSICVLRGV